MSGETILTVVLDEHGCLDVVLPDGRCCGGLSWDEMLGQVAKLTLTDNLRARTFEMRTPMDWQNWREERQQKHAAMMQVKTEGGAA